MVGEGEAEHIVAQTHRIEARFDESRLRPKSVRSMLTELAFFQQVREWVASADVAKEGQAPCMAMPIGMFAQLRQAFRNDARLLLNVVPGRAHADGLRRGYGRCRLGVERAACSTCRSACSRPRNEAGDGLLTLSHQEEASVVRQAGVGFAQGARE